MVKVSDEDLFLMGLSGDAEVHAQAMLASMEDGMVVLTLGEDGAHLITQVHNIQQAIFKAEYFADTVGAGDTFFSAMLSQLLRDKVLSPTAEQAKLAYALKFGSLAASINVAKVGCQPPSYKEVLNKLNDCSFKSH